MYSSQTIEGWGHAGPDRDELRHRVMGGLISESELGTAIPNKSGEPKSSRQIRRLVAKGMPYGWATITALVRGLDEADLNSRARQLAKDLADIGYGARIEDAMAMEAIKEPGLVRQPRTNDGQPSAAPPGRPGRVAQRPS